MDTNEHSVAEPQARSATVLKASRRTTELRARCGWTSTQPRSNRI